MEKKKRKRSEGGLRSDLNSLSELAIRYYNQQHHKGKDEFKLVVPLSYTKLSVDESCDPYLHLSFIAKNHSTSKLKMFFAEFSYDKEVLTCAIVEPGNPLFQSGCMACLPVGVICHPLVYQGAADRQGGYRRLGPYDVSVQRLLREKYTIRPKVQKLNAKDVDKLKEAVVGYAQKAVKVYNRNNGASYEYLEPVFCVRFRYNGYSRCGIFWAHLFFKARNKGTSSNDAPVLLFAELGLDSDYVSCVTMWNTPSGSLPKITCSGPQSKSGCHKYCPIRHSENAVTEPGSVFADCEFGAFADCWCEGQCWGVRSELHEETGVASENAWLEFIEQENLPGIFS